MICFLALTLSGCAQGESDLRSEIRLALANEPPTLDPSLATDNVSHRVLVNLFDGLTEFDADLNPVPAAAASWDILEDGRVYRFHLRPEARWTDGQPVKAGDFEYAWKRLLAPETASEYAYFLYDLVNAVEYNSGELKDPSAVGVRALSDTELEVRLRRPTPYLLAITTYMVTFPLRKDVIERFGEVWTEPEHMVTNGPYRLEEWRHEYRLVLGGNPRYWAKRAPIEKITFYVVEVETTALNLYETGYLDMVKLPPDAIPSYRTNDEFVSFPFLRGYYYGFNIKKPPFSDVRVRKAFAMAIDKTKLPEILKGGESPTNSWIPKGMLGYNPGIGLGFNPSKAQKLLAEAGYPGGERFPKIRAVFNTSPENLLVAPFLQSQWKKHLNVDITLDNQEWKFYLSQLNTDPPPLFRLGWGADYPDPDNFMNLFTARSGNNKTGWANAEFDRLIEQAAQELDPSIRMELYNKAQNLLCQQDLPIIPLFTSTMNMLVKDYLRGFLPNAMDVTYVKNLSYRRLRE
ncbi:MAG: peptide ABC transporter substrate-binding protein [Nitrospirae bacterium]|nr:peptide ABC transporter substrate-binding protein [Nitrospirota bacterium]